MPEERPYEVVDGTPVPRYANGVTLTEFARVRPASGERLEHAPLCEDSAHPVIVMGKVVVVKGARKVREARYVCAVCRPRTVKPPEVKRTYPPRVEHPEPPIVWMGWPRVLRLVGPTADKVPPWFPGPEPAYPDPEVAEAIQYQKDHKRPLFGPGHPANARIMAYRTEHREWERWSKECEQWRARLVMLHMREDDARKADGAGGYRPSAMAYEA